MSHSRACPLECADRAERDARNSTPACHRILQLRVIGCLRTVQASDSIAHHFLSQYSSSFMRGKH